MAYHDSLTEYTSTKYSDILIIIISTNFSQKKHFGQMVEKVEGYSRLNSRHDGKVKLEYGTNCQYQSWKKPESLKKCSV